MASSVFLDTSGWLALLNATEGMHSQANSVWFDLSSPALEFQRVVVLG